MSGPEDHDIERAWAEIVANWDRVATTPPGRVDTDAAQPGAAAVPAEQQDPRASGHPGGKDSTQRDDVELPGVELRAEAERRARLPREPARSDIADHDDPANHSHLAGPEEAVSEDALWTEGSPIQDRGPDGVPRLKKPPAGHEGPQQHNNPDRHDDLERTDHPQRPGSRGACDPTLRPPQQPNAVRGLGAAQNPPDTADNRYAEPAWERLLDEHFVPQEPPPIPHGTLVGRLAWAGVLLGPVLLLLFVVFWRSAPTAMIALPAIAVLGGFITLVARLPGRRDEDDRDDGAVV